MRTGMLGMASLDSLPIHLIAEILRELDHVGDLPAVLLSCKALYSTLSDTPSLPLDILRRQIPEDLFDLALTALVSQRSIWEPMGIDVHHFLANYYDDPFGLLDSRHLTLNQALHASRLHDAVSQLRDLVSGWGLRVFYSKGPWSFRRRHLFSGRRPPDYYEGQRQPLSPTEDYRICRALYRIQIYNNLFFGRYVMLEGDLLQKALFFERHSPWVNSQLEFVWEYLENKIRDAWNTLMVDEFSWGDNLTTWMADRHEQHGPRRCLSLDLPMMCKLLTLTANNWPDFEASSNVKYKSPSTLGADLCSYYQNMESPPGRTIWALEDIELLTREGNEPALADEDRSPRVVWMRIYGHRHLRRLMIGRGGYSRRWHFGNMMTLGYMMWDGERLEEWRIGELPSYGA